MDGEESGHSTKVDEVRSTEINDRNEDWGGTIQKGSWSLWHRQVGMWNRAWPLLVPSVEAGNGAAWQMCGWVGWQGKKAG